MAQTLFAICIFAGALALVSAQNINFQDCSSKAQAEVNRYRECVMQASQRFTNSLQDTAGQAADISGIQKNIDKLTLSISSLSDMSNGFDIGRVTSVYLESIQTMTEIGRQGFRPALISGGLNTYIDLMNSIMRCNTSFMQSVTSACMPANRST